MSLSEELTDKTLTHLKCDNERLRRENKGLVRVVSHLVRWYRPSRKVNTIIRRLEISSSLPFGQQRPLRAHWSCGDLGELLGSSREREREEEQTAPVMKDKIVEARPRSSKRSNSQKENKKSNVESSLKESNGFKGELEWRNPRPGTNDKFSYKTDFSSARLVNGASPKLCNGDIKNKSKQDLEDIKAIIKLDRLNSTESKLSNNSFDFP